MATVDLWGAEPEAEAESGSAVQMPRTMRQKPSSSAPAVKLAHPGQSYNPSYDDHVDAVSMAVQHISKEEEADRFWKEKLGTTVQQINSYATYAQEMAIVPATKAEEEGGSEHESDSEADEVCVCVCVCVCARTLRLLAGRAICTYAAGYTALFCVHTLCAALRTVRARPMVPNTLVGFGAVLAICGTPGRWSLTS